MPAQLANGRSSSRSRWLGCARQPAPKLVGKPPRSTHWKLVPSKTGGGPVVEECGSEREREREREERERESEREREERERKRGERERKGERVEHTAAPQLVGCQRRATLGTSLPPHYHLITTS